MFYKKTFRVQIRWNFKKIIRLFIFYYRRTFNACIWVLFQFQCLTQTLELEPSLTFCCLSTLALPNHWQMLVHAVKNSCVLLEWKWNIIYGWCGFCAMYTCEWKPKCVVTHLRKHKQYFITDAQKETDCRSFPSEIAWSEQPNWPNTVPSLKSRLPKEFCLFHAMINMLSYLVMFQSVVLHWRKIFKIVVASLTSSADAPNLLCGCLLGKGSNLATCRPNIKFNLAI